MDIARRRRISHHKAVPAAAAFRTTCSAPAIALAAAVVILAACKDDCPTTDPTCRTVGQGVTAFSLAPSGVLEGDTVYAHVETRGVTGALVIGPLSDTILSVTDPEFDAPFVPVLGGTYTAVPQPNGASRTTTLTFIPLTVTLTITDRFPYVGDTVTIDAAAPIGIDTLAIFVGTDTMKFLENSATWQYPVLEAVALEVTAMASNNAVTRSRTMTMIGREPI